MQSTVRLACVAVATALCTLPAWSQPPEKTPPTEKPPWEWTLEERLAARFDPQIIGAVLGEHLQQIRARGRSRYPIPDAEGLQRLSPGYLAVGGRDHPELFFPTELFNSMLSAAFTTNREGRQITRPSMARLSKGIEADDAFWRDVSILSAEYLSMQHQVKAIFRQLDQTEDPEDRERLQARLAEVQRGSCRLRWEALQACREHFGKTAFDRFLYEAVAPGYATAGPHPDEDSPPMSAEERLEHLRQERRFIETGGCPDNS